MFIEELIIDGFKSYASRTVISNWDREFNAITGLNGSGKSNILDAICFVLGIENLKQVRASTLQDLVYKRGQAGITKASVTIVFNNEDKARSPVGFGEFSQITVTRQVIIGGKNKYLINGHNVPQKSIENLFQSVGLNINNPHFLIMQGQITKVLNMKPIEILSLIEEAAGTRMFEDRKEKALSTFEKKEGKVKEITQLLNEIIVPKLDKLREERTTFIEFQKLESDIERLKRSSVAVEFFTNQDFIANSTSALSKLQQEFISLSEKETFLKEDLDLIMQSIDNLLKNEKHSKKGNHVEKLELKLHELSNELVRLKTLYELENEQNEEEKRTLASLKNSVKLKKDGLMNQSENFEQLKKKFELKTAEYNSKVDFVMKLEELVQSLKTGLSSKDGKEGGFSQLVRETKEEIISVKSKIDQSKMKIDLAIGELKEKIPSFEKNKKEFDKLHKELSDLEEEKNELEKTISNSSYNLQTESDLTSRKQELLSNLNSLEQKLLNLESKVGNLTFKYQDPTTNFDRRKVKGLVANLISIKNEEYSNAIEVCAGGRLYNVVVENEVVASQLLESGKLTKRVTIIPLNKISPYKVPNEVVKMAKEIAPGKVELALSIVGYEKEVELAMEYVFGSTFICDDKETANLVAFDKKIRSKCVTLDGDVYDPSGTLTGGSLANSGSSVLSKLSEMNSLKQKMNELEAKLSMIDMELESCLKEKKKFMETKNLFDLKSHKFALLSSQFKESSVVKLHERVEFLQLEVEKEKESISTKKHKLDSLEKDLKKYEKDFKEFDSDKEVKLKELEVELKNEKMKLNAITVEFNKIRKEFDIFSSNQGNENEELESKQLKIKELEESTKKYQKQEISKKLKQEYEEVEESLSREREILMQQNKELIKMENEKKKLTEALGEIQLAIKQYGLDISKVKKGLSESQMIVDSLKQKHLFLENITPEDKRLYMENKMDKKLLSTLEEKHSKLSRNVNVQVMDLIDRVEKKESNLKSMLSTVKKDRLKIELTINKLNDYKKETLMKTWQKVNMDFGQIFQELLPNSTAKLELNGTIMDGILVKVCLGGIWKQSLTELSGGQRSLVALALILSLLQYNPAPMYILDEVDAALDLSHTQNIGTLLKSRFKGSQFIVVSLKDGMFSNANCLFKTKFKDGISFVDRIGAEKKIEKKRIK